MVYDIRLRCSIVTLETLFDGCESAEGWRHEFQHDTWEQIPKENNSGALPAYQLWELSREEDDVEGRFGKVGVDGG